LTARLAWFHPICLTSDAAAAAVAWFTLPLTLQDTPAAVSVEVIPRSREVGQSYITSVFTTLYSLLFAAGMVLRHRPQLVSAGHQPADFNLAMCLKRLKLLQQVAAPGMGQTGSWQAELCSQCSLELQPRRHVCSFCHTQRLSSQQCNCVQAYT
jgi:hypothetical protein